MLNLPAALLPSIDTPVKDRKQQEPLTADSEPESSPPAPFQDISAEALFRQFSQLVRVTEQEHEAEDEEDLERRLTYDTFPTYRLEFEPKSSMKKRPLRKDTPAHRPANPFRPQPLSEVSMNKWTGQSDQCFTPVDRVRKEHPELLLTPHKERECEEWCFYLLLVLLYLVASSKFSWEPLTAGIS